MNEWSEWEEIEKDDCKEPLPSITSTHYLTSASNPLTPQNKQTNKMKDSEMI